MGNIIAYNNYPNLSQGLISYYKLDGNSNDVVGSNNGTDTSVSYSASYGKINQGALFNGTNSTIAIGTLSSYSFIQNTGIFSINMWVRAGSLTQVNKMIIGNINNGSQKGFELGLSYSAIVVTVATGINSYGTPLINNFFTDLNYHMLTVTRDGSLCKFYKDGNLFYTSGFTYTYPTGDSTYKVNMGSLNGGFNFFTGSIDEVAIYNKALTPIDIIQLYNSNNGLQYPFISTPKILSYKSLTINYLIVAGGGGGAGMSSASGVGAGGGGAGGFLTGNIGINSNSYPVIIGSGGSGGAYNTISDAYNGGNSSFNSLVALGGGGAGGVNRNGLTGGSGGGTTYIGGAGLGTAGQGNNGAAGGGGFGGSGGGGAGQVGHVPTGSGTIDNGGAGGNGLQSSISGTLTYYAGGGGGGSCHSGAHAGTSASGGLGGGGSTPNVGVACNGGDGTANTGGGGSGATSTGGGGAGGSGIVIISYPTVSATCTGGAITYANGNTIHTFLSNDTFTVLTITTNSKITSYTQAIDNDLQAWLNLLTVQPSSTYTNALNILIIKLKTSGIWQELDRFWLFATEQRQHAQIDVKGLTTITEVNAPTWTSLSGYKFDGSTNYINTNYNISTSTKFLQDSASFGGYLNIIGSKSNQRALMGLDWLTYTLIYPYSSVNTITGFCNSTNGYGGVNMGDGLGLITANRNSPTNQYATQRNNIGTIIVAGQTSGPRQSLSMYIGCFNTSNNLPAYYWNGGLSMCYSGSGNIIPTTLSTYFQEFATTLGFAV